VRTWVMALTYNVWIDEKRFRIPSREINADSLLLDPLSKTESWHLPRQLKPLKKIYIILSFFKKKVFLPLESSFFTFCTEDSSRTKSLRWASITALGNSLYKSTFIMKMNWKPNIFFLEKFFFLWPDGSDRQVSDLWGQDDQPGWDVWFQPQ